ncbi:MAG: STAS domain-containing protein [Acidobacteria bacterium]|nr:STAS domain-containing protein [Acidobacteriota bacterium]
MTDSPQLVDLIRTDQTALAADWMRVLTEHGGDSRISAADVTRQTTELVGLVAAAARHGLDVDAPGWHDVRSYLGGVSQSRATQGFTATETATFVFSLKRPLFERIQAGLHQDPAALAAGLRGASELVDTLGMHTIKAFQQSREAIITRQQEELLELSTPVVTLSEGVLALPMIGTLDSARTQVVMESLLQRIVETGAEVAIIDITGVPTVDTLVAQHLLKTVTAIRLMGAEAIISGIRPQIAQTIVHLGVDLQGVTTKANLADALAIALHRTGQKIVRISAA